MTNKEVTAWAERFWLSAGRVEPFPRSLESSVVWALPLAVIKLPHLGLFNMNEWLIQKGIIARCPAQDRRLRACLFAKAGCGFVFLDGNGPDDERRFSLAHEVVHFISDYLEPRNRALTLLGDAGRDVLDGRRPPTPEERLRGVLHNVEFSTYTHLIERSPAGSVTSIQTLEAEDRADRLALELIAPRLTVLAFLKKRNVTWWSPTALEIAQEILAHEYGLPVSVAKRYGEMLIMSRRPSRTFKEWLGGK